MMPIPEPFTAIPITAGILTNVASDILKHHAQSLDGTPAGRMLKWAGLIEPNLLDRLRDVLKKTLELYFKLYPERELPGIDDFFRDPVITEQISGYILCRLPVDTAKIQQAWERHLSSERVTQVLIQYKGLEPERIIGDFLECYRQVLREQLSVPQIAILLDLLEQNQALVDEIQASEERMRAYITRLMESKLSPQALGSAYQSGQQELATSLAEEMNVAGLVQSERAVQTIQTRLQHLPALFKDGLCKGRPLSIAANQYFVSHGFSPDMLEDWRETLTETLAHTSGSEEPLQPYFVGDTLLGGFRLCGIIEKLYATRFCTFLLPPSLDRNVYLELGIAISRYVAIAIPCAQLLLLFIVSCHKHQPRCSSLLG
jgi:hypothetical protein